LLSHLNSNLKDVSFWEKFVNTYLYWPIMLDPTNFDAKTP
jgi:hypothetical protein